MLNLETILDIVFNGSQARDLGKLLIMYYQFLIGNRSILGKSPSINIFSKAHCSFDEFYNAFIDKPRQTEPNQRKILHELLDLSGIDFDEFKQEL